MEVNIVRDAADVAAVARRARDAGRLALDVEFLWERTYAPIPCLVQVAVDDDIALIDPIAGAPLAPIADLLADPDVTKLMHAPASDLTLFVLHHGVTPAAVRDTQLIAGFAGFGAGASLGTLLERALDVRLAKTESYSDWMRRPLSDAQLDYAADDVRFLRPLVAKLDALVAQLGRTEWVREEHDRRFGPDVRWAPDPASSWRKVKGQGRLSGAERAAVTCLAAWRETLARERDRPVQWVLPDRALLELAKRRPRDVAALRSVRGVPEQLPTADRTTLLAALEAARSAAPPPASPIAAPEIRDRLEMLGTLGSALVAARAGATGVAASLIANRDEVATLMRSGLEGTAPTGLLSTGWRWDVAGASLAALAAGKIALAPTPEPPYVREVELDTNGGQALNGGAAEPS